MSDVRRDIERAAQDQSQGVSTEDLIKWGVGIGGGALAGRFVGKRIKRMIEDRRLPNIAMRTVTRKRVLNDIAPSNAQRMRDKMRRK